MGFKKHQNDWHIIDDYRCDFRNSKIFEIPTAKKHDIKVAMIQLENDINAKCPMRVDEMHTLTGCKLTISDNLELVYYKNYNGYIPPEKGDEFIDINRKLLADTIAPTKLADCYIKNYVKWTWQCKMDNGKEYVISVSP